MEELPEAPPQSSPDLGWCLILYGRMSRRARRRLAALLVAAALAAQPLGGFARGNGATGGAWGGLRAPMAEHAPAPPPGAVGTANPNARPAVARALRELGLAAPAGLAITPAGGQFQVNTYTTSDQANASVALDADGDFVVVWESQGSVGTDFDGLSIQAQRYNAAGVAQGSQFQVNTYTTSDQANASVAMDADGDFVVVWESQGSAGTDTSFRSMQAQRYNAAGAAQGGQFQVNTYPTFSQLNASVAMDADGDFVVVWESLGSFGTDTSGLSIQAQRYNAAGSPQGGEFQVNTFTTGFQRYASVALDADGDFVVVWQSFGSPGTDLGSLSIQGQRYNAAGTAQGGQFQVNTYTTGNQVYASVAMDADGDFVVVWDSDGSPGTDTSVRSIQGQRYNAAGTAQGGQFQVNTYTTNSQRLPSVAMDADGDFVVVWESDGSAGTDTSGPSIQGQDYDAAGAPQGGQFQVNTFTTSNQLYPSVAMDADGDSVVAWQSAGSPGTDTSGYSVQGQRFLAFVPPTPTPTPAPPTPTAVAPTAVVLRSFRAIGLAGRAILVWETASEVESLGFQMLRAPAASGPWTPVGALTPAEGGAASGGSYVLHDAPGPGSWHYRLEEVGTKGQRTLHPAIEVRVGPDALGSELFVPRAGGGG